MMHGCQCGAEGGVEGAKLPVRKPIPGMERPLIAKSKPSKVGLMVRGFPPSFQVSH